jgi:hypothetical protein
LEESLVAVAGWPSGGRHRGQTQPSAQDVGRGAPQNLRGHEETLGGLPRKAIQEVNTNRSSENWLRERRSQCVFVSKPAKADAKLGDC